MNTYVILLRGINVGGNNIISMADLKKFLEASGYSKVTTYIASGNVILQANQSAKAVKTYLEDALPKHFQIDNERIKVLVLTRKQLQTIVDQKPAGFGEQHGKYHSDVIFLMDIQPSQVLPAFDPREGVDTICERCRS